MLRCVSPCERDLSTLEETAMTDPAFRLMGLDHLVLRVTDLQAMMDFYCGVLGCTVDRRQPDFGLTQLRAGRSLIDLIVIDGALGRVGGAAPGAEGRNLEHFCIGVHPFDEAGMRAHLDAHGVAVVEAGLRYGAEGRGYSLYVRDPQGNTVELKAVAG
jgi:glyoxylase I family protein